MKIRIEVDENIQDDEVIIRCANLNEDIQNLQGAIKDALSNKNRIISYKDNTQFYISLDEILFFETEETSISAHTLNNVYEVKYKLYELEGILPNNFMRVSKSTILNVNYIYSITRNLTSSSLVEFKNTHKKVYVSRYYYKPLKIKLSEMRR